jgi:chitodextrinase
VGDWTPPNVSVASPADGGAVTLPTTITVSATDNVGVAKVELYRQRVGVDLAPGTLVGTDTSAPYTFPWVEGQSSQYALTAVAYDTSGITAVSPTVTVNATQSDTTPPTDPGSLRATSIAQTSVATTWTPSTDNVAVAYYQLFRDGVSVATTSGTSFTFTGLSCGSGYRLAVAAVDTAGNASPGVSITAWTTACSGDTQPPSMPTNVQATATGATTVRLTWQASTDNVGIYFYRVDRDGVTVSQTSSTTFNDSGLVPGKTYAYTVTAYDAVRNASGTSAPVSVTTGAADTQPPSAPTGVQAGATGATTISVSWQPSTDNVGVSGYRVYRNGIQVGETISTSFADAGLSPATAYTYTVVAYDAAGNVSAASSPASATTSQAPDTQAPTAPGNLQGTAAKGRKAVLSWTSSSDNVGVTSYRIFRDGVLVGAVSALTYTDTASRGAHSYYVVALDAAGNQSPASNTVTLTL